MGVSGTRRIGVIGGTFDPIHYGHLVAAQECAAVLGCEKVLFVPAHEPPHKLEEIVTAATHRAAMVEIAIADNPRFVLSTVELDRGGVSYTVDTLRTLREELGGAELHFIVGIDALLDLPGWHDPAGILRTAFVAAVSRPGYPEVDFGVLEQIMPGATHRVRIVPMPGHDISSTDLRERLATGRPVRYLLPDAVIAYAAAHGLYRD